MIQVHYKVEYRDLIDQRWKSSIDYGPAGTCLDEKSTTMVRALFVESLYHSHNANNRFYRKQVSFETRIVQVKTLTASLSSVVKGKKD